MSLTDLKNNFAHEDGQLTDVWAPIIATFEELSEGIPKF